MRVRENYNHTLKACYLGGIIMAIINNFIPLLFLTFQSSYGISLEKITLLVTLNFLVQLTVDLLASKFVDRIGYRKCIVVAQALTAIGMAGLAFLPDLLPSPYAGLVICIVLYAMGGGLDEVLLSPIVEACPTEKKDAAMSMMHSFYCWGSILVIVGSTVMFSLFGIENWRIFSLVWALIPLFNTFYFTRVPIYNLHGEGSSMGIKRLLSQKVFWIFALLMVCAGASELAMSQWASAFAEAGLGVSKTMGDLLGPCLFAVLMGISRVFYSKFSSRIPLMKYMIASGFLCIISFLMAALVPNPLVALIGCGLCGLAVSMLWPGTLSLAAERFPTGGTALFALLALGGDLGCSSGPTLVGFVSAAFGGNLRIGMIAAIGFPLLMILGLLACGRLVKTKH